MERQEHQALEDAITRALVAGDLHDAATRAIRGYGRDLLHYLRSVLQDSEAASDVFAELCSDMWRGLAAFRRESSFRTWAYRLAWNAARDHVRDVRRRQQRVRRLETTEAEHLADELSRNTPAGLRSTGVVEKMARIAAMLDLEERSLLLLRVEQQLPWKDVANVVSQSGDEVDDVTVRKRFDRLKRKIRDLADAAKQQG
jgi:RNA polymerase sigma-70 factor, ECF subfamily